MDGNHSLLASISFLINCEDAQSPFIINIVLCLPANMCVMWFILAGPREKASALSYLNQAICEVFVSIASAMQLFAMSDLIFKFVNLTYLEYTMRFLLGFLFSGRPLFMSSICLERYLAVVHPVTFLRYKLLRYRLAETVIFWLTVLVCCIILTLVPQPAIARVCFSISFSLFLVQVYCCVGSLCALMRPRPGDRNGTSNRMNAGKLNAFRIILIILVTEAITFVPYFFAIIFPTLLSINERSMMFCIASYGSVITGLITPFHYIYKTGKLQHCFRNAANLKLST